MPLTASSLVLAIALSGNVADAGTASAPAPAVRDIAPVSLTASTLPAPGPLSAAPMMIRVEEHGGDMPVWMRDRKASRPATLPAMYATLGVLQAMDLYSTRRALGNGAVEANPLMRKAAGNSGAMLAVKALSSAGSIYFAERAWKKNRKGAVVVMAIVNGLTAAVVANNLKNAK